MKASRGEEYLSLITSEVMRKYNDEIKFNFLITQLSMMKSMCLGMTNISDLITWSKAPENSSGRRLLSEVAVLLRLLMVVPATNAISERSFSTLRRVKTYLRSTMTEERLNHLMTLHIYKESTSSLDIQAIIKAYVEAKSGWADRKAIL